MSLFQSIFGALPAELRIDVFAWLSRDDVETAQLVGREARELVESSSNSLPLREMDAYVCAFRRIKRAAAKST